MNLAACGPWTRATVASIAGRRGPLDLPTSQRNLILHASTSFGAPQQARMNCVPSVTGEAKARMSPR